MSININLPMVSATPILEKITSMEDVVIAPQVLIPSQEEKLHSNCKKLSEFLIQPIPYEIDNPQKRSFGPVYQQVALMAAFISGTIVFEKIPVLNIALADNVALILKNLIRTTEKYFENQHPIQQTEEIDPVADHLFKKIKKRLRVTHVKYAALPSVVIAAYLLQLVIKSQTTLQPNFADTILGVSIKVLQRELDLYYRGKGDFTNGNEPSISFKVLSLIGLLSASLGSNAVGLSPLVTDVLLNSASVPYKHICKNISSFANLGIAAVSIGVGYGSDWLINLAKTGSRSTFKTLLEKSSSLMVGPTALTFSCKAIQRKLIVWQIGKDDEDEEGASKPKNVIPLNETAEEKAQRKKQEKEIKKAAKAIAKQAKEKVGPAKMYKQVLATTAIASIAFVSLYMLTQQGKQSGSAFTLATNSFTQTTGRMASNIGELVNNRPAKIALLTASSLSILGQALIELKAKDILPVWILVATLIITACSTRFIDKTVKNFQLGKKEKSKKETEKVRP